MRTEFRMVLMAWAIFAWHGNALADLLTEPLPVPGAISMFAGDEDFTFDPGTHDFMFSNRLLAVQFPGEIIDVNDPLVLADTIIGARGQFSGTTYDPLQALDTSAVMTNVTRSITVNGILLYEDFIPELTFDGIYRTPNTAIAEWEGTIQSKFIDITRIDSPFLSLWASTDSKGYTSWRYGPPYNENGVPTGHIGTNIDAPPTTSVPEPKCSYLIVLGLVLGILYRLRFRRRAREV